MSQKEPRRIPQEEIASLWQFLHFFYRDIAPKITRKLFTVVFLEETRRITTALRTTLLPVLLVTIVRLTLFDPAVLVWILVVASEWRLGISEEEKLHLTYFEPFYWVRLTSHLILGSVAGSIPEDVESSAFLTVLLGFYFEYVRNLAFYRIFMDTSVATASLVRDRIPREELQIWLDKLEGKVETAKKED